MWVAELRLSIGNCITGKFNKIIGNLVPVTHFDIGYRSITHFDIDKLSISKMVLLLLKTIVIENLRRQILPQMTFF